MRETLRSLIWLLSAITIFSNGIVLLSTILLGGGSITIGQVVLNSHDPIQRPFVLVITTWQVLLALSCFYLLRSGRNRELK